MTASKIKPRYPKITFDSLQMFFGEPYVIDLPNVAGSVTVLSPKFGDVVRIGQRKFYQTLNLFTCNTTQYRLMLWDAGIDWNEMSDFELFIGLYSSADPEVVSLLFKDLDFRDFNVYLTPDNQKVLYDQKHQIEINEEVYQHFHQYIQTVFNSFPEEKLTPSAVLREWYIEKDRRAAHNDEVKAKRGDDMDFSLVPLISACINHPGFKYKLQELREVGVQEFFDSVQRLQIYEQSTALMKGMYQGFVDGSKIKPKEYNFMRPINE